MRAQPPQDLIDLVQRLHLADAAQVHAAYGRVRRLARDLPLFESVWVDALAQARILSPFQAAEINAGRGGALGVGSHVLCQRLSAAGYAEVYLAQEIPSRRKVRLAVFPEPPDAAEPLLPRLEAVAAKAKLLGAGGLAPISRVGRAGDRLWASSSSVMGRTAADWMVHNGRFPADAVLEIARQMLSGLQLLERAGICHGDLSAANLLLTDRGQVVLLQPGLRGIVRREEGYAHADLMPEYYDYLAPERVLEGTPPSPASDFYACGCLWWHLLTGRPPVAGGNGLAKLQAIQAQTIPDVRRLAPGTSAALANVVAKCLRHSPEERPRTVAELRAALSTSTKKGQAILRQCVRNPGRRGQGWTRAVGQVRDSKQTPLWLALGAACVVALAALAIFGRQRQPALAAAKPAATSDPAPASAAKGDARLAIYEQPLPASRSRPREAVDASEAETGPRDLVLESGNPQAISALELRPGQCVRGKPGRRPLVVVPRAGLPVTVENVRFLQIDFVASGSETPAPARGPAAAIVRLEASRAEFRGCSFQAADDKGPLPAAIIWTHPMRRDASEVALPSGRVQLSDCVFRRVDAAICCETVGAVAVEMSNSLHLGFGPLIHLDHAPRLDEPVVIELSALTLRGSGPLVECAYQRLEDQPGTIAIQTQGCVLAGAEHLPLLNFTGPTSPERLLGAVQWTGQGSLVGPKLLVAQWRQPDGRCVALDDSNVSIAGLARSEIRFASEPDAGPAAHRVVRWQGPLNSPSAPGADPQTLHWPQPASP